MSDFANSPTAKRDQRDRDKQDAWSSAFPADNCQPFDRHSFGRMDRPNTLFPYGNPAFGTEICAPNRHTKEPFAAPSNDNNNNNAMLPDDILATPPRLSDEWRINDHTTPPARRKEDYRDADKLNSPPKPQDVFRNVAPGEVTPYMGLRARLTQVPINRWTVLLMLILARLIILFESINTDLASAKDEAAAACLKTEEIGSAMASMPHYLSVGVNELVAMGITDTVRGLIKVLVMILSGILEMLMFMIERTYGTIVCVATSFIKGLISLAAAAVEDLLKVIDEGLQDLVAGVSTAVDKFANGLNSAMQWFTGSQVPSLSDVDAAVNKLKNADFINATATFDSITNFNNKIPNFNSIIADVQAVVGIPFTTVEILLNESFGNWSMDPSVFPTAATEQLNFCTGNDAITELFDVLFIVAKSAKIIVACGLLLAALLAAAFMAWLEFQRYRKTVIESKVLLNREPMDTIYISGRPLTAKAGLWMSRKASNDPNRQMLVRWVVAYATTHTALLVLSLAAAGALSALSEFFIMRAIQKEEPGFAQEVGTFVTKATNALESSSTNWANESNQAILDLQNDINDKILVHVQDATGAVVKLIDTFENETSTLLENFFGNNPIGVAADNFTETLLDCVIFNALNKVKSGIIWINEEAHVTFPEFPFDTFSMGATGGSDGNSSFSTILNNSASQTANDITRALNKVEDGLQTSMIQESLIALALFLIYVAYVFFAVAQAALRLCCMKERAELPKDAETGCHTTEDLQASQHATCDNGRLARTTRSHSLAPSYRLSDLDVSQLARELSVTQEDASPVKQREAKHGEDQEAHSEEVHDPFGDDTYAIGDEEVDDIVGALRDSLDMAAVSTSSRISQSVCEGGEDDALAIGDDEVDDILLTGLRTSREIPEKGGPRNRQAWAEAMDNE